MYTYIYVFLLYYLYVFGIRSFTMSNFFAFLYRSNAVFNASGPCKRIPRGILLPGQKPFNFMISSFSSRSVLYIFISIVMNFTFNRSEFAII